MKNKRKITIGIFGFGNMGRAIFSLLQNSPRFKNSADFLIFDAKSVKGVKVASSIEVLFKKSQVVFLCIKPQDFYKLNRLETEPPANRREKRNLAPFPFRETQNHCSGRR